MMAKQVTNRQILDTLIGLGVDPAVVNSISAGGAQSTTFKERVKKALIGKAPGRVSDLVDHAFTVAKWESDPKASQMANLESLLRLVVPDKKLLEKLSPRAEQLVKQEPMGLRAPGTRFGDVHYWNAIKDVIGITPEVQHVFRTLGIEYDPITKAAPVTGAKPGSPEARAVTGPSLAAPVGAPAAPGKKPRSLAETVKATSSLFQGGAATTGISMDVPKDKAGIMNLQRLLNERGANLKVDGLYGPATKAAHQQYGTGQTRTAGPAGVGAETLGSTLTGGAGGGTVGAPQVANVPPPLSATASDAEVEAYIRREFGFAAWALDVPEIRNTLVDFTKRMGGYEFSEEQLEAELLKTQWWQEKNNLQRQRIEEFHRDPMTYNQNVEGVLTGLREEATKRGVGFNISDDRLMEMAQTGYKMGWSIADRQAALAAEFDYDPQTGKQAASAIVGNLRAMANNYLVPLSEATIDEWGKKLIAGTASEDTINGYLREQAKQMLPSFAAQIDAGLTPQSLVEPYRQTIAREMGSDPNQVDFLDPKWNRFINTADPKTGTARPMSFFEIQQTLRTDSSYGWDKSDVAHREATEFATQLAQRFGKAG